ncbi:MAG: hypothetical protein L3J82_03425 [Planctomycetes bacterium]|nr:hypothetical protein [Planctomycetota bacterium]
MKRIKLKRPSKKTVWKWTKRSLIGLLVLVAVSVVGFELWRQHGISVALEKHELGRANLAEALKDEPSYSDFRKSLVRNSDGTAAFKAFLMECHGHGAIGIFGEGDAKRESHTVRDLSDDNGGLAQPLSAIDAARLRTFLEETKPMFESLKKVAEYDSIVLDENSHDYHAFRGSISSIWLFGLVGMNDFFDRITAHRWLGDNKQAQIELDTLLLVSRALESSASSKQFAFTRVFSGAYIRQCERLARAGALDVDHLQKALDYSVDWRSISTTSIKGTLLAFLENPDATLALDAENSHIKPDMFAWLNPYSYDEYDGQELLANTLEYEYYLGSYTLWFDYSLNTISALDSGEAVAEKPEYMFLLNTSHNWDESALRGGISPPATELSHFFFRFRILENKGLNINEIRSELDETIYLELDWTEAGVSVGLKAINENTVPAKYRNQRWLEDFDGYGDEDIYSLNMPQPSKE